MTTCEQIQIALSGVERLTPQPFCPTIQNLKSNQLEQPIVSVIIVHHSGMAKLRDCLSSVFASNYPNFQVILVDNGSQDNSVTTIKEIYGDNITVIRSENNLGFVGGNNLGLNRALGSKYVVLLNDDTVVQSHWLDSMIEVAEADPKVAVCQPKLLSLNNPKYFEYNGAAGGFLDVFGVPLTRGRVFELEEKDEGQYDKIVECFWGSGAAMFLRTNALIEAGLLDSLFYAHMEEIDLCWRLQLLGYRIVSVPFSIVYHLGGGTPLKGVLFYKQRNNLIVMLKNFSTTSLLRYFPLRVLFDWLSFLFFLRDRNRSVSILKAYFWVFHHLKSVLKGRYLVQSGRKVPEVQILEKMMKKSVAVQYYVLRRKRFNQLIGLPGGLGAN
jgi:GT2 family glycosyltransferase